MDKQTVIISVIVILALLLLLYKKQENLTGESSTNFSNESVQNTASIDTEKTIGLNKFNVTMNKLNVTSGITGDITGNVTGDISGNIHGMVNAQGTLINGGISDGTNRYRLGVTNTGAIGVYDMSTSPWTAIPLTSMDGGFTGKLFNSSHSAGLVVQDDLNMVMYCSKNNSPLWNRISGNGGSC